MPNLLEVNNLDVGYNSIPVLRDVSISLGKHERVALIGPNAAGKTTTFKTIMGMLKPTAGIIELEGERIEGKSPNKILEMGLALVPEGRMIFPDMNVLDNIELGAYIHGGAKNASDTLEWVYQLFPILKERKDQMGGSLSGGEQQMLAIGRALMSKPRVLLLDEPSQGLAPIIVKTVFDAMEEIRKSGTSILVSEQNVRLALDFCDRGYILENGRIVMEDQACNLITDDHVKEAYLGI
ncbi:MAG: ABC transporter ATP-binding protein [Candidatus Thorarchaeota archaeon]